ncbi:porin [Myroides fluvii]|uniref:porin n=1 Tax=Myroides fluvii TaxID=2572594 RepID=UPI00131D42C4|nr:porin [Myroides fluvii]
MKRLVCLILIGISTFAFGQQSSANDSLTNPLIPVNKQNLLKDFDLVFYMRYGLDSDFKQDKLATSRFSGNELRIDLSAKVHEKVGFRFRNRFTSAPIPGTLDNVNSTVDIAFIDVKATDKLNVTLGKLSADWGGYEFDLNPIEVLEYNDILNHSENYLVGVGVGYQVNEKHRFNVQVLNASANRLDKKGTIILPKGIEETKVPLAFVGNWRGSFWDNQFQTSYSYSYFTQAKNKGMYYIALGNKYQNKQLTWMYDFQYTHDAIDRHGIISSMSQEEKPIMAKDVAYLEHWTRLDYQVYPKLIFSLTLMTSNAYAQHTTVENAGNSHIRVSYGASPMIQYSPFKKLDLRFYAAYVGRWYANSSYAKTELGQVDGNTGRISIGFISPLQLL